jgi:hypothetical protein
MPRRAAEVRRSLRLSLELDEALKEIAVAESRSVNGAIEHAVRVYIEAWRRRRQEAEGGPAAV